MSKILIDALEKIAEVCATEESTQAADLCEMISNKALSNLHSTGKENGEASSELDSIIAELKYYWLKYHRDPTKTIAATDGERIKEDERLWLRYFKNSFHQPLKPSAELEDREKEIAGELETFKEAYVERNDAYSKSLQEINRLKVLIKSLYVMYNREVMFPDKLEKHFEQFKTENNL